ncbi:uncharacterized protein METZ01_LOCUS78379, partial [marine metagenome]
DGLGQHLAAQGPASPVRWCQGQRSGPRGRQVEPRLLLRGDERLCQARL